MEIISRVDERLMEWNYRQKDAQKASDAEKPEDSRNPEEPSTSTFSRPSRDEYIPEKKTKDPEAERCIANTDKVDREIEKLKKQKQELEQRLRTETDETKVKNLKSKLAQVENELRQKDNDAYRRQHTVFS